MSRASPRASERSGSVIGGHPVVDVHAHHFPQGLPDLAAETGDARWPSLVVDDEPRIMLGETVFRPVQPVCFDVAARLAELDAAGVDQQVVSPVPITLVDWAPPADAGRFLSAQNDLLADLAYQSTGRLIALGAVPMQDPALAVQELRRIRDLGMAGVEISASAADRELDDPSLEPFWAAAADLDTAVFVHPARQLPAVRRVEPAPFGFGLEMLTDTALAAGALVFGGVLARHPQLRVALAHGCGTFPWTYPRMRYITTMRSADDGPVLDRLVGRLWTDALVFDAAHVGLLIERFGADHVMYGTDHPFLPEGFAGPLDVLRQAGCPGQCYGANALRYLGGVRPPVSEHRWSDSP